MGVYISIHKKINRRVDTQLVNKKTVYIVALKFNSKKKSFKKSTVIRNISTIIIEKKE